MSDLRRKKCVMCSRLFFGSANKSFCSLPCRRAYAASRRVPVDRDPSLGAAETDWLLEQAVERECAPPWVRHPQPWTNVAGRQP